MRSQDPYDDEPHYLDWGKWLRIVVTAVSGLALLALLLLAATDEAPSLPQNLPTNPTIAPETSIPGESGGAHRPTASPRPTATPTATPTAPAGTPSMGDEPSPSGPLSTSAASRGTPGREPVKSEI